MPPPSSDRSGAHRLHGDDGTGLFGTTAAVVVFLVFLLFAVQLLIGLYSRSVVTAAAYDGARHVAGHGAADRPQAVREAEDRVRQQVGGLAVRFDWSATTDDTIVLRLRAESPRFLLPGFAGPLATDHIDRTATAHVERLG